MGFIPGIKAFAAAVLGGIGNIRGAMIGGLLLGVAENLIPTAPWVSTGVDRDPVDRRRRLRDPDPDPGLPAHRHPRRAPGACGVNGAVLDPAGRSRRLLACLGGSVVLALMVGPQQGSETDYGLAFRESVLNVRIVVFLLIGVAGLPR